MAEHTWIVVADGRQARVIERRVRAGLLTEREDLARRLDADTVPRDRPPRAFESVGTRRHGLETGASPHERDEARFVAEVCAWLNAAARERAFDALVLIAPPCALGLYRAGLDDETRARITREHSLDLVNMPRDALLARLRDAEA
jgi:protein required for attachment to host cells